METNPTQTKKYKLLLITDARGNKKHVPSNPSNKSFYNAYKSTLSKDKREKYTIEEVELTVDEAAEIGVAEAHAEKYPVVRKGQQSQQSNDIVAMLLKQNQELAERLAVIEAKKGGTK